MGNLRGKSYRKSTTRAKGCFKGKKKQSNCRKKRFGGVGVKSPSGTGDSAKRADT